jgi:hypothetical protein
MILHYFRRVWRAVFCKEPIYIDGFYVGRRVQEGASLEQALREKAELNRGMLVEWDRGRVA